ncbi:MAG: diacylglycerol kinase [Spirochaetaceae bacterium]|jgi:diacylglycerol kinase family enzyme|nr:diacylglycerol kinase [Spirochaetaceae bacterium]
MKLEDFAAGLWDICTHTPLMTGRPFRWIIIANPKAGGFIIPSRWKRHYYSLREYALKAKTLPPRDNAVPMRTALDEGEDGLLGSLGLIPTRFAGHAGKIMKALLKEAAAEYVAGISSRPFYLVICAGGDGTSLEIQTVLYHAAPEIRENLGVVRFPMGTGNDGADARELADVLALLLEPCRIEPARALRLTTATAGKGPFLAFNILSVGLDAFVTHMTNKMKGTLPGDFYKLWVDIAALFYDRLYTVGPLDLRVFENPAEEGKVLRETVLLLAVGASGRRTYGANKRILPDDRNVCLVRQMPLVRKLALKGLFTTGAHAHTEESLLFNARRIEFRGEYPILAQMDGESVLLTPKDFPAAIELTEPVIPLLKK